MTRQNRLIAVLLVIAAVGVCGLMVVANQYRKALGGHDAALGFGATNDPARGARLVEGFLAVRTAVKEAMAPVPEDRRSSAYGAELDRACAAHGLTRDDYIAVRRAWRSWRAFQPVNDPDLARAFEAHGEAAVAAGMGSFEAIDAAIR